MVWFRRWGWIYRPVSVAGWLATALTLAFCAQVAVFVDSRSHSVSDTFYRVFPYAIPALLLLDWLASRTSPRAET
ncbi:MAG: hypothetical protein JO041_05875 [Acidobacteria bacterium]|nr:hypothetical protein [Acidobacteriota bacterium]